MFVRRSLELGHELAEEPVREAIDEFATDPLQDASFQYGIDVAEYSRGGIEEAP